MHLQILIRLLPRWEVQKFADGPPTLRRVPVPFPAICPVKRLSAHPLFSAGPVGIADAKSKPGLKYPRVSLCFPWEGQREYLRQWPMRELKLFAAQLRKEGELAVQAR